MPDNAPLLKPAVTTVTPKAKATDWNTRVFPTWCPGCGDFGIWAALKQALTKLGKKQEEVVIVYGIGCSGNMASFINTYGFHGLHGRALPVATGVKLANPNLTVIVVGGDGDGYGIGMGHFIHTMRRNLDITYLVHNNAVYGLTTGQTSPTSAKGYKSKSTPEGVIEEAVNPITLALASGATSIARGLAADIPHLSTLIEQGIQHKGFALIDIYQHCITFNKINTVGWYKEHTYPLDKPYGPDQKSQAFQASLDANRSPVGVIYKEERPTYTDEIAASQTGPIVKKDITNVDISTLFEEFR